MVYVYSFKSSSISYMILYHNKHFINVPQSTVIAEGFTSKSWASLARKGTKRSGLK